MLKRAYLPQLSSPSGRVPVHQTLPNNTRKSLRCPFTIFNSECAPFVVAEIKFTKIALQVLLADVMVRPIDAALKNSKVTFSRVDVRFTANVFASIVINEVMFGKFASHLLRCATFVSHDIASAVDLSLNNRSQVCSCNRRNVMRADSALALD